MLKIIDINTLLMILKKEGLNQVLQALMSKIDKDFARWQDFDIIPRPAFHVQDGVIELMPICDQKHFAYKYVNGHPLNPQSQKQTVIATGQLSKSQDGYPLLISEMTILTALRTAAMAGLATNYFAQKRATVLSIIGTGAQAEFQILAHTLVRNITQVRYFDIDPLAMDKFEKNIIKQFPKINFVRCGVAQEAVAGSEIIIVVTACKKNAEVIKAAWIKPGMHINGLGGDCPGKTELDQKIFALPGVKTVVEYFDQSFIEGEIQKFSETEARKVVTAEMWEVASGQKTIRHSDQDITIFDSVGIALEDYTVLRLMNELAKKHNLGLKKSLIPHIYDPKNLFGVLTSSLNSAPFKALSCSGSIEQLADNVFQTAVAHNRFQVTGHSACKETVGIWSGAAQYYGEIGLVYINPDLNSCLLTLLGEGDREYIDLYGFKGKINPENIVVINTDPTLIIKENKEDRQQILHQKGVQIHYLPQVQALGLDKILQLVSDQFQAKEIYWGISTTAKYRDQIKKLMTSPKLIGIEIKK